MLSCLKRQNNSRTSFWQLTVIMYWFGGQIEKKWPYGPKEFDPYDLGADIKDVFVLVCAILVPTSAM